MLKTLGILVLLWPLTTLYAQVQIKSYGPFKYQLEEDLALTNAVEQEQQLIQLVKLQQSITDEDRQAIQYWNASYPSYRWHQIMMEISRAHKGHKNGGRVVILHLSIYDALVEVWKHKGQHQAVAPFRQHPEVQQMSRDRDYSSFLCEWSSGSRRCQRSHCPLFSCQ